MRRLGMGLLALAVLAASQSGAADDKDAARVAAAIDRLVNAKLAAEQAKASPLADDAEFMRRAYLDLNGTIPTTAQALAFLGSDDPAKRSKLIDELLARPAYGKHFGGIWRDLILRPDANMIRPPNTEPLAAWLAERFNKNAGWDAIVNELLTVDGAKPEALFFILNGDTRGYPQANVVAGSVGQLFMGTQLACAECHNHPFVDKWKQDDFWGVAAFFGKVQNGGGAKGNKNAVVSVHESTGGVKDKRRNMAPKTGPGASIVIPDTSFKQVGRTVKARLPHGETPALDREKPFRPAFARWLVAKDNPYFAANAVNRMWGHLLGRAFANPVGEVSEVNPHSHPELVKLLSRQFAENGYDLKSLIRSICASEAYQRTSRPVEGNKDADERVFSRQGVKVMSPEVLYASLTQALEVSGLSERKVGKAGMVGKGGKGGAAKKKANAAKAKNALPGDKERFLAFYATKDAEGDATEYTHGIPQALRLMNQGLFNTGGETVPRVARLGTPEKAVEALYLAVLSRRPAALELREGVDFVARAKTKDEGYRGVFWALVNSAEFILVR